MSTAEVLDNELAALHNAVLSLGAEDLWSPQKIRPLYSLCPSLSERPWEVDLVLDGRRRVKAWHSAAREVSRATALQQMIRKAGYDAFSAMTSGVTKLIEEYDELKRTPDSVLRYIDGKLELLETPTVEELRALERFHKLRLELDKNGIDVALRDDLIDMLIDFNMSMSEVRMKNESIDLPSSPLLQATASYLAKPSLQCGYLTRDFALCFLVELQKSVAPQMRISSWLRKYGFFLALAVAAAGDYAGDMIVSLMVGYWILTLAAGATLVGWLKWVLSGAKAHRILGRLIEQFSCLGMPSTCDGRELVGELDKLKRMGVSVPSLLFSLFRITLPGR